LASSTTFGRSAQGSGYGIGKFGKIISPLGLALIVGGSNFIKPAASVSAIVPAMYFLAFWPTLAAVAFMVLGIETRGRSIEEIDSGLVRARGRVAAEWDGELKVGRRVVAGEEDRSAPARPLAGMRVARVAVVPPADAGLGRRDDGFGLVHMQLEILRADKIGAVMDVAIAAARDDDLHVDVLPLHVAQRDL
jgi:hypothetical protein